MGALLAGGLLGALLFQFAWMPSVKGVLVDAQSREVRRELQILSDGLLPFMLGNQFGAVQETLHTVESRYDNWAGLTLERPDGRRLYPLGEPGLREGARLVTETVPITFRGETHGILSATVDLGAELALLRTEQWRLAGFSTAMLLCVMLLVAWLTDRLVSRRLVQVARASDQMAVGNYNVTLPEGEDEVGILATSFRGMRDQIKEQTESLKRARRNAEDALEARSRFVATMSHEIRTPLNGVIPVAEMLSQTELAPDQRRKVETIQKSGIALLSVVNDILDVSMIEGGHLKIQSAAFNPAKLIGDTLDIVRAKADEKQLEIVNAFDAPADLWCLGDEGRLRQVLVNLVGNALKFTEQGQVRLSGGAKRLEDGQVRLELDVTDTGIGIPAQALGRIFDRFEQVDDGLARRFGGTGLGLAISKHLVDAMGGQISVSSVVGEGSTFRVVLDLPEAHRAAPGPASASDARTATEGGGRLVLLADDNEINREVASDLLCRLGFQVDLAEDGAAALAKASQRKFDLILMDIHMPVKDGLEATQGIREGNGPNAGTQIVGLTASVQASDMAKCREAGMNDFISKPLEEGRLLEVAGV